MTTWGLVGAAYGLWMITAALARRTPRPWLAGTSAVSFALASLGAGTLHESTAVNLLVPGALLLAGYWLSGLYFLAPDAGLEAWLTSIDRRAGAPSWRAALSPWLQHVLELSYAADYVVVGGGALLALAWGETSDVSRYWSLVLASELLAFAALPWLQSRPPRALEVGAADAPDRSRRLNLAILDRASIQANTLPSGHVSGATAAALAMLDVSSAAGASMLVAALLIAVAAVAGRYHYLVDCVAGAVVAVGVWLALG